MARAIICDRCGKVYQETETKPDLVVVKFVHERFAAHEAKDLCDECTNLLYDFMHMTKPDQKIGYINT